MAEAVREAASCRIITENMVLPDTQVLSGENFRIRSVY